MTQENRDTQNVPMTPEDEKPVSSTDKTPVPQADESTAADKTTAPDSDKSGATSGEHPGATSPGTDPGKSSGDTTSAQTASGEHPGTTSDKHPDTASGENSDTPPVPETYTLTREQMDQLESSVKQLDTLRDQFLRLSAEYDNYRKRTAREKEALWQDAKADTIRTFLGVYDNLERAVKAGEGDDSPHQKGLVQIFRQYQDILKNLGVSEIDAQGKPFDPECHNAVMHIDDDKYGENTVAQVFQTGFRLGDKVIRHAAVQVAN